MMRSKFHAGIKYLTCEGDGNVYAILFCRRGFAAAIELKLGDSMVLRVPGKVSTIGKSAKQDVELARVPTSFSSLSDVQAAAHRSREQWLGAHPVLDKLGLGRQFSTLHARLWAPATVRFKMEVLSTSRVNPASMLAKIIRKYSRFAAQQSLGRHFLCKSLMHYEVPEVHVEAQRLFQKLADEHKDNLKRHKMLQYVVKFEGSAQSSLAS